MTHINLADVKPDPPLRDLRLNPVDPERVENLRCSIREFGFWGGPVLRRNREGGLEMVTRLLRIRAATAEGYTEAKLYLGEFSDYEAIIASARENATHRESDRGLWRIGAVASALRYIAIGLRTDLTHIAELLALEPRKVKSAAGHLLDSGRIGPVLVAKFLKPVPRLSERDIRENLKTLQASGDYNRIISEAAEQALKETKKI